MFREAPSFLRCCDLIFRDDVVHYWIQGMLQGGVFQLLDGEEDPLLPVRRSTESILRSALATVDRIRYPHDETKTALELAAFFQGSRGRDQFQYTVSPDEVGRSQSFDSTDSAVQLLNALPFGREYSKETRADRSMVWRAQRAANGSPVATDIRRSNLRANGRS